MKLLYGTTNLSKLQHMKEMLQGLNIEISGLKDIGINIDIDESGKHPLENAKIKAMTYYRASGIPTFSCDSGLYIEELEDEKQPGVHVRRVNNKYLNDEKFIKYYTDLVLRLGKEKKAKFKNAICLVLNENNIFEYDGDDITDNFIITAKAHHKRKVGFPMDSISLDIKTRKYLIDIGKESKNEEEITKGFRSFFIKTILSREWDLLDQIKEI